MALKIIANYSPESNHPRPLGDDIYFFSYRPHVTEKGQNPFDISRKYKMQLSEKLEKESEYYMYNALMANEFESFRLSEDDLRHLRISNVLAYKQGLGKFLKTILPIVNKETAQLQKLEARKLREEERQMEEDGEYEDIETFENFQENMVLKASCGEC
jgi:hypothetical protein